MGQVEGLLPDLVFLLKISISDGNQFVEKLRLQQLIGRSLTLKSNPPDTGNIPIHFAKPLPQGRVEFVLDVDIGPCEVPRDYRPFVA